MERLQRLERTDPMMNGAQRLNDWNIWNGLFVLMTLRSRLLFFSTLFTIRQQSFPSVVTLTLKVIAFSRAVMARKR